MIRAPSADVGTARTSRRQASAAAGEQEVRRDAWTWNGPSVPSKVLAAVCRATSRRERPSRGRPPPPDPSQSTKGRARWPSPASPQQCTEAPHGNGRRFGSRLRHRGTIALASLEPPSRRRLARRGPLLAWAAVLRAAAVAVVVVLALSATAAEGSARSAGAHPTKPTPPLRTGFLDPRSARDPNGFAMMRAAGAQFVRIAVFWKAVAPMTPPSGFDASDPTSPGYSCPDSTRRWEAADTAGLTPISTSSSPPSWGYEIQPGRCERGDSERAGLGVVRHRARDPLRRPDRREYRPSTCSRSGTNRTTAST